jgi:membrane protein
VTFLAGGVAFNILLAGVPFILLLASAVGYLYGESLENSTAVVQQVLDGLLPPQVDVEGSMLDPILADVVRTRALFGIGGALGFLLFSARLFGSLRSVMATVFAHGRDRTFLRGMLWDVHLSVMTVALVVAWVVLSAWLTVSSGSVGRVLTELGMREETLGGAQLLLGRTAAMVVIVAIFGSLYRWLPKKRTPWIPTLAGAVASGALFELARWLFGLAVRAFPPGSIYSGTLGALVVVVFWTYYAALIFVLGAELAAATCEQLESEAPGAPVAPAAS